MMAKRHNHPQGRAWKCVNKVQGLAAHVKKGAQQVGTQFRLLCTTMCHGLRCDDACCCLEGCPCTACAGCPPKCAAMTASLENMPPTSPRGCGE